MGLLPCETVFSLQKTRTRTAAAVTAEPFSGAEIDGYEIHMGLTRRTGGVPFCRLENGQEDGAAAGTVFGTYLHGLFDSGTLTERLAAWLLGRKGLSSQEAAVESRRAYQERQYDLLAADVRSSLDMAAVYGAMDRYARK